MSGQFDLFYFISFKNEILIMTAFMKQFPSPMMRQDKFSFLKHFLRMFGRLDQRPYMAPTKLSNLGENVITRSSFNPDMTNPVER